MQPTGNVKSTRKLGVMAQRKILYPQILFLEKKGPWGTASGSKSQQLFPDCQSHWNLFLISKNNAYKLYVALDIHIGGEMRRCLGSNMIASSWPNENFAVF